MNIFKFEFKTYLKSNIVWTISILLTLFLFISIYPIYSSDTLNMNAILESFPEPFLKAFGLNPIAFTSLTGYYTFSFIYITLIGGIFAAKLGLDVFSKEIREKVGDFLLVKPVKRETILLSKLGAIFSHILIMNLIFLPSSVIFANIFSEGDYDLRLFILMNLSLFFIQLFFMSFGVLISIISNKLKSVLPVALGITFGGYVIQLLNQTLDDKILSYLTPFGHFDYNEIIRLGGYSAPHLVICIILSLLFLISSFVIYRKKDIPSV